MSADNVNVGKNQMAAEEFHLDPKQKAISDDVLELQHDAHLAMKHKEYGKVSNCYEQLVEKHKLIAGSEESIDLACDYSVLAEMNTKMGNVNKAKDYEDMANKILKDMSPICYDKKN